jgi:hypothetical protein
MTIFSIKLPAWSRAAVCSAVFAAVVPAQQWEVGVGAGMGVYTSQDVSAGSRSGSAGMKPGPAAAFWLTQNMYRKWAGELRYTWQMNDLKLESGSTKVSFAGRSQAVEYSMVYHFADLAKPVRPYVAFGGGMKLYQGTGSEVVVQPLNQFAFLTHTSEWKPMASVAAGVKARFGQRMQLRVEARDAMTPIPTKVIAPAPGASLGGWIHDFMVIGGISILF